MFNLKSISQVYGVLEKVACWLSYSFSSSLESMSATNRISRGSSRRSSKLSPAAPFQWDCCLNGSRNEAFGFEYSSRQAHHECCVWSVTFWISVSSNSQPSGISFRWKFSSPWSSSIFGMIPCKVQEPLAHYKCLQATTAHLSQLPGPPTWLCE